MCSVQATVTCDVETLPRKVSEANKFPNKMLGRARDLRDNSAWLSKLTE